MLPTPMHSMAQGLCGVFAALACEETVDTPCSAENFGIVKNIRKLGVMHNKSCV